jgi:cardiolipin synthase
MQRPSKQGESSAKRRVLTIANGVTLVRAGFALWGGALFWSGGADRAAVWLCAASVLLDAADGWIARRWGQETVLGTLIDPVADKIAVFVVFGTIAVRAASPAVWSLFALGTLRDASVTAQRLVLVKLGRRLVEPDSAGKFKTIVQDGVGLGILFHAAYVDPGLTYGSGIVIALVGASVGLSWFTWGRYTASFRRCAALNPTAERVGGRGGG